MPSLKMLWNFRSLFRQVLLYERNIFKYFDREATYQNVLNTVNFFNLIFHFRCIRCTRQHSLLLPSVNSFHKVFNFSKQSERKREKIDHNSYFDFIASFLCPHSAIGLLGQRFGDANFQFCPSKVLNVSVLQQC